VRGDDYTMREPAGTGRLPGSRRTKEARVKQTTQERTRIFAQHVREHKKAVFSVAYAKLRNVHDAEDVMQEVFVEAYRNFHRMKKPEKIRAWLQKATVYRCSDHMRKTLRRRNREQIFSDAVSAGTLGETPAEQDRRNGVLEAIGLLPEKYRLVVMLKHFARLSYADISEITGLSKTSISGRLQAARKKLKATLIDMGEGVD
jgi:RNA polymerase sigma-70 factor (ECF subfamily)